MNPREKLLGIGILYQKRGEPIPLDLLVKAERYGLMLEDFGEPLIKNSEEGDEDEN